MAKAMFWVSMTDPFFSGTGNPDGKTNKVVMVCETYEEASIVEANVKARGDMKYINICSRLPRYPERTHYTQIMTKADYPEWYQKGYF